MQSEAEANVAMVVAAKDTISNSRDSSTHDGSESVSSNSALTRRVTRKVDVRLLPILGLTYLFAFLDRTNIANAKLNGFEKELGMPSNGYNTALWVFFLPFVLLEVPCNIVLGTRKVTPGQWLGGIMFVLGEPIHWVSFFLYEMYMKSERVLQASLRCARVSQNRPADCTPVA